MTGTPTGRGTPGGASATASAPSSRVYAHTQPGQWDTWYAAVTALSADINLLRTVDKALHRAKALDPGDWDDEPDAYQLCSRSVISSAPGCCLFAPLAGFL